MRYDYELADCEQESTQLKARIQELEERVDEMEERLDAMDPKIEESRVDPALMAWETLAWLDELIDNNIKAIRYAMGHCEDKDGGKYRFLGKLLDNLLIASNSVKIRRKSWEPWR